MPRGKIYLFPTPISDDTSVDSVLPSLNLEILQKINYFVVENVRTARRFISKCHLGISIDSLRFVELSEHTTSSEVEEIIKPIIEGEDCILMSEAGVPAIADPGSELVRLAHINEVAIVPLVGPSSIIMALMSSGMNGQSFVFHGYLPVKPDERNRKIEELSRSVISRNQTQIFIETPYRNLKMFESLCQKLPQNIRLCIAANISSPTQFIHTKTISQWKNYKGDLPINKVPAIFVVG